VLFQLDAEHLLRHPARQLAIELLVLGKADIGVLIVQGDDLLILRIVLQLGARELQQVVHEVALLHLARPAAGGLALEDARQRQDRLAPRRAQLLQHRHQVLGHAPVMLRLESGPLGELLAQYLDLAHQAVEGLLLLAQRRRAPRRDAQLLGGCRSRRGIEEIRLRSTRFAYCHRLAPREALRPRRAVRPPTLAAPRERLQTRRAVRMGSERQDDGADRHGSRGFHRAVAGRGRQ
jgi:hypothetical protein